MNPKTFYISPADREILKFSALAQIGALLLAFLLVLLGGKTLRPVVLGIAILALLGFLFAAIYILFRYNKQWAILEKRRYEGHQKQLKNKIMGLEANLSTIKAQREHITMRGQQTISNRQARYNLQVTEYDNQRNTLRSAQSKNLSENCQVSQNTGAGKVDEG